MLTALLFQLFLGNFGAGSFYLGYTAEGVGHILLTIVPCYGFCCLSAAGMAPNSDSSQMGGIAGVASCLMYCAICGVFIWNIVDIVGIATYAKLPVENCYVANL